MSSPLFIQETRDYLLKSQLLILLDTIRCSSGQRLNDGDGEEGEGSDVTAISATDCKECLQCTRDAYTSLTSSDTPRTRITTL